MNGTPRAPAAWPSTHESPTTKISLRSGQRSPMTRSPSGSGLRWRTSSRVTTRSRYGARAKCSRTWRVAAPPLLVQSAVLNPKARTAWSASRAPGSSLASPSACCSWARAISQRPSSRLGACSRTRRTSSGADQRESRGGSATPRSRRKTTRSLAITRRSSGELTSVWSRSKTIARGAAAIRSEGVDKREESVARQVERSRVQRLRPVACRVIGVERRRPSHELPKGTLPGVEHELTERLGLGPGHYGQAEGRNPLLPEGAVVAPEDGDAAHQVIGLVPPVAQALERSRERLDQRGLIERLGDVPQRQRVADPAELEAQHAQHPVEGGGLDVRARSEITSFFAPREEQANADPPRRGGRAPLRPRQEDRQRPPIFFFAPAPPPPPL